MADKTNWAEWYPPVHAPGIGRLASTGDPVIDDAPIVAELGACNDAAAAATIKGLETARRVFADDSHTATGQHLLAKEKTEKIIAPACVAYAKVLDKVQGMMDSLDKSTTPGEPRPVHSILANALMTALWSAKDEHQRRTMLTNAMTRGNEVAAALMFNLPSDVLGIDEGTQENLKLSWRHARHPQQMKLRTELQRQLEWGQKQYALAYKFRERLYAPARVEAGQRARAAVDAVT